MDHDDKIGIAIICTFVFLIVSVFVLGFASTINQRECVVSLVMEKASPSEAALAYK